ncbi:MAG TPA: alpha/beta hydrolase fold domain-containing protein [Gaiellaceae bacterium]|jgi:acetyl esterase|nr:alpha/beta hydrolase fold domain-containing protein [Gaiellaceae bacterium]
MPHEDNSGWMSMLAGKPVTPTRYTSVEQVVAGRSSAARPDVSASLPELAEVHEGVVLGERDGHALTAELYVPLGEPPFPALVYLHGGGWCRRSAADARFPAMHLAAGGHLVLNLDYGLAPEHPFPRAVEDAVYAARWLVTNGGEYGGDGGAIAIGGESAGANLSLAAIAFLTGGSGVELDEGDLAGAEVSFSAALLAYGIFDFPLLVTEPGANIGSVEWMWNAAYLGPHFLGLHRNPLVSPVYAPNLDRFPPAYLGVGDEDSLLSQSLAMTKAFTQANVPTTLSVIAGCDHAFLNLTHLLPEADREFDRMRAWLGRHTGAGAGAG